MLQGVSIEEVAVFFLALILGFLTGRRDKSDISHQSHLECFWVGFEHGYQAKTDEEIEEEINGIDNTPLL